VIISAIELVPSDSQPDAPRAEQTTQPDTFGPGGFPGGSQGQVRRPSGRTLGQVVSLRMEMAAYFRRTTMEAQTTSVPQ
jgi:hypothetical protein